MANMSYCRFRNTFTDMVDCYDNIDYTDNLSPEEIRARKQFIRLCVEIADDYGDEL